ncbi:MFS transporter [uncultured Pelagimonas sp.]|uniref:MFS transporter n=1 Tax=uncultured Pelagimonas sp. TaxID=1618102 RepID=UPI002635A2B2|nr:MFS transporter [uncultured Pelagimonas sp.]
MSLFSRNPGYGRLLTASAVTNLGDGVSALAFPWLATLITRDPMLIALVGAAVRLPWLLFSIPAGVITDRGDRKQLILRSDWVRFALTLAVIGLILSVADFPPARDGLYIAALAGLAFLLGSAEVLRDNAAQTLLPSIVQPDDLEAANGRLWTVENVMGHFVGPPLAGVLIALALPLPFLLDAVSFAVAAILVAGITLKAREARIQRSPLDEAREAWAWMRAHPVILKLALMLGLLNGLSIMGMTLVVLVSQEILGLSAAAHGVLLTSAALGGVVGGLLGPRVIAAIGQGPSLWLALGLFPLPMLAIALTSSPWVVGGALFVESFAALLWNIVTVSYRQRVIPDDLLGRVNSVYRFFGWGGIPIGALLGGAIVAIFEPSLGREMALRLPYWGAALGMTGLAIYGWRTLRV